MTDGPGSQSYGDIFFDVIPLWTTISNGAMLVAAMIYGYQHKKQAARLEVRACFTRHDWC